jgi:hypothetical protein
MERKPDRRTGPVSKTGGTTECEGQDLCAPQNWQECKAEFRRIWRKKSRIERVLIVLMIPFVLWALGLLVAICVVEPTVENFAFIFRLMFWSFAPVALLALVDWLVRMVKDEDDTLGLTEGRVRGRDSSP